MKRLLYMVLVFQCHIYAQSVLLPNINETAKILRHGLNVDRDSIVLKSDFTIYKVEIIRDDFIKSFDVADTDVRIPISDLDIGRYTVAVFVNRKVIAITLLRQEPYKKKVIETDTIYQKKAIEKRLVIVMQEEIIIKYDTIWLKVEQPKDIIVKEIPYDLSTRNNNFKIIKQSRKDYRKTHLRPNGNKYNKTP